MCDLAYVNLLREKVRYLKAEEKRIAAFGDSSSPSGRFVPWTLPAELPSQTALKETPADSRGR
jgi:hypothetical protein